MKVILLKRKLCGTVICLLVAVLMFYVVNCPPMVGATATQRQLPIYCVQRDQKLVSISFDEAWVMLFCGKDNWEQKYVN